MFFQGFLHALGYAVGCFVFIFMMLTALVVMENLLLPFRRPKRINGANDIREWQHRRTSAAREVQEDFRPAG
jgi:hypothetical protein